MLTTSKRNPPFGILKITSGSPITNLPLEQLPRLSDDSRCFLEPRSDDTVKRQRASIDERSKSHQFFFTLLSRDLHDESIVDGFQRVWDDGAPSFVLDSRDVGCPKDAGDFDEQRGVCDVPPDADSVMN